jgi:hypothetical protein
MLLDQDYNLVNKSSKVTQTKKQTKKKIGRCLILNLILLIPKCLSVYQTPKKEQTCPTFELLNFWQSSLLIKVDFFK